MLVVGYGLSWRRVQCCTEALGVRFDFLEQHSEFFGDITMLHAGRRKLPLMMAAEAMTTTCFLHDFFQRGGTAVGGVDRGGRGRGSGGGHCGASVCAVGRTGERWCLSVVWGGESLLAAVER